MLPVSGPNGLTQKIEQDLRQRNSGEELAFPLSPDVAPRLGWQSLR